MPPTPGKISYVQIPAVDFGRCADFYETVFGWNIRRRDGGQIAFDDTSGEVSGTWVSDRPPSSEPGLVLYINVESVQQGLEKIVEAGGEVVTPLTPQGEGEAFATFRDPAGNVLGIFHEGGVTAGRNGP
jgi:predicted enzyme related to lactoylglutathione lyase